MARIEFYGTKSRYSEFSNFYPAAFIIENVTYKNVEQYFQASKATLANDIDSFKKIMGTSNPVLAKRYGRAVKDLNVEDWNLLRDEIMLNGVREKFKQNVNLAVMLEGTGTFPIAEVSPRDYYWGTGRSNKGLNKLGNILMKVRDEIKSKL